MRFVNGAKSRPVSKSQPVPTDCNRLQPIARNEFWYVNGIIIEPGLLEMSSFVNFINLELGFLIRFI